MSLDSLYWRDSKIKRNASPKNPYVHKSSFTLGNKLVKSEGKNSKMPFQLKKDDVVVRYFQNEKKIVCQY